MFRDTGLPVGLDTLRKNNNSSNNIYLLQLGCHPVAVVILHVYRTWNWLLLNLIYFLVINQIDVQNLFYSKFISSLYMFRGPRAHRQEVKIVLYSLWYHHTETSEWYKITKITKILTTGQT